MVMVTRPRRQVLATVALLAFTVAPTGYVGWLSWRVSRPGYVREVEREIGAALGLRVALEGVRYPRPGEVVYRGAVLSQEEPRRKEWTEVARAKVVRLRRGSGALWLEVEGLRLHGEGPRQAMTQVSELLRRADESAEFPRVGLSAPSCEVALDNRKEGGLTYRFRDVVGEFRADDGAPTATVSYRVTEGGPSTRCELSLTRDRSGEEVRTSLAFRTMEGPPLPARVLDPFFGAAGWLGPAARVEGALTLVQAGAADWQAEFRGTLLDVDLGTLVGGHFPDHRLAGRARVTIARARWDARPGAPGYGWVEAEGELASGAGTIGMGLVQALRAELRFQAAPRLLRRQADLPFRALAVRFALTPDGELRLGGGFGPEFRPGAVLVDAQHEEAPLWAPEGASNVLGLVNALVPRRADGPTISGGPEAQALQAHLPLPPAHGRGEALHSN